MAYGIPQLRLRSLMGAPDDYLNQEMDYGGYEDPMQQDMGYETMPAGYKPLRSNPIELGVATAPEPVVGNPLGQQASSGRAGMGAPPQQGNMWDYTPETQDRDRLRSLMDAAPQREPPGWLRGLSAIGVGLGSKDVGEGLKNMEAVNFAPHRRDMADWTAKTEPYLKTAELENRGNINERTLAGNMLVAQTNADRIEAQRVRDEGKQAVAEKRAESDRIYRTAQAYNQRLGKGYDWDLTGTTIKKINKTTGDIIDTGLKTDRMTEEDKILLQNEGKVEAARVTGELANTRAATAKQESLLILKETCGYRSQAVPLKQVDYLRVVYLLLHQGRVRVVGN